MLTQKKSQWRDAIPFWKRDTLDPVERTMRDLAHQGTLMARLAHLFATVMVVLFSLGSLVALSGDALTASLATLHAGGLPRLPDIISIGVSTALVLCCDVGMVYAATVIRVAFTRGVREGMWLHYGVMVGVAVVEAGTYLYMSWRYEAPATWAAWALIVARAASAPLLAIYLSMARALPITSRDILHQAELAQGIQLVRDVVRVAQDPTASLADKMQLYEASAEMQPKDRQRLAQMIAVVQRRLGEHGGRLPVPAVSRAGSAPALAAPAEGDTPTLPGEAPPLRLDRLAGETFGNLDDVVDDVGDDLTDDLGPMPKGRYSSQRLMARVEATR
jgi:hypothetical protein